MINESKNKIYKILTILPLFVFLFSFLLSGIILNDFYKLPAPIAVLCGIISAFLIYREPLQQKIQTFIKGCGQSTIITMCLIYLLAGAFAAITKSIGAPESIVYLGISFLSPQYLYAGTFLIAAFLSFSTGTSVGCIATLTPIMTGFSEIHSINAPLIAASLLSGAMFGDNLSLISDTTIAATQTQNCSMQDKFNINSRIAIPAAIVTFILLTILGYFIHHKPLTIERPLALSPWLILPYVFIIILSLCKYHVFIVLGLGIIFTIPWSLWQNHDIFSICNTIYQGSNNMTEIFLLSLLSGGLTLMVEKKRRHTVSFQTHHSFHLLPKNSQNEYCYFDNDYQHSYC